jgi:hypothetical protein
MSPRGSAASSGTGAGEPGGLAASRHRPGNGSTGSLLALAAAGSRRNSTAGLPGASLLLASPRTPRGGEAGAASARVSGCGAGSLLSPRMPRVGSEGQLAAKAAGAAQEGRDMQSRAAAASHLLPPAPGAGLGS